MSPEHGEVVKKLGAALKRSFDMPRLLLRVKKVTAKYLDWCRIVQTAEVYTYTHSVTD
jgi:DNA mismatch repair ATPase MutS